jgi:hypothetical protein
MEGFVRSDEERLFGSGGFSKGIGDIGFENEEVFSGSDRVEQSSTGLFDAIGVCFCQDPYLAGSGGTVTYAACLLSSVNSFDVVRPYKVEDSISFLWCNGEAEHSLCMILV